MPSQVDRLATAPPDWRCQAFTWVAPAATSMSRASRGVASRPTAPRRPGSAPSSVDQAAAAQRVVAGRGACRARRCRPSPRSSRGSRRAARTGEPVPAVAPSAGWRSKGSGAPPARSATRRSSGSVSASRRAMPSRKLAGGGGGVVRSMVTMSEPREVDGQPVAVTGRGRVEREQRRRRPRRRGAPGAASLARVRASSTRVVALRERVSMASLRRSTSTRWRGERLGRGVVLGGGGAEVAGALA